MRYRHGEKWRDSSCGGILVYKTSYCSREKEMSGKLKVEGGK